MQKISYENSGTFIGIMKKDIFWAPLILGNIAMNVSLFMIVNVEVMFQWWNNSLGKVSIKKIEKCEIYV